MRILCLEQFSTCGGAQRCLLDLIPFLHGKGCELEAILPAGGTLGETLQNMGVVVRVFQGADLSRNKKRVRELLPYWSSTVQVHRALRDAIRAHRPDLLYVNGPRYLPAAAWIASGEKIPLLFHAHHSIQQRAARMITRRALRSASARVLACCEYVARSLRPHLHSDALNVVYNGVPDLARGLIRHTRRIRTIGVLGRIAPEKGQLEFMQAMRRLRSPMRESQCVIFGRVSGDDDSYFQAVARAAEGLNVTFKDWTADVAEALSGIDLLVVPSAAHDAAPRVILEAFSALIPVLACPAGGDPRVN